MSFGDILVDAQCIQPGVLKCLIPSSSKKGTVELGIYFDGKKIDCGSQKKSQFEYKTIPNSDKKNQIRHSNLIKQSTESYRKEFKLRIIHCLKKTLLIIENQNSASKTEFLK